MYAENKRSFHGHRIRPDRHRTDAGEGSLPEAEYDLIAKVEADSYDAIGKLVVSKIRSIEGVKATKTLARVAF